jgi:hypothetical protein
VTIGFTCPPSTTGIKRQAIDVDPIHFVVFVFARPSGELIERIAACAEGATACYWFYVRVGFRV